MLFRSVAQLTVPGCALQIPQQPADVTVFAGQTVTFNVGATGTPPPNTYQWQSWGPGSEPFTNIPPAIGPILTFVAGTQGNGTRFRCVVGNGCTNAVSAAATLRVLPPPAHDFAALGMSLERQGLSDVYNVIPQVGITLGASATNPLPLDFEVVVNGV